MSEPIFERIYEEARDTASRWFHPHHEPPVTMTTNTTSQETADMSLITTIKHDIADLAAKADSIDEATAAKIEALEGNPVIDALLAAAHVPATALNVAVDLLNGLASIYPRPADTAPQPTTDNAPPAAAPEPLGEPAPAQ